MLASMRSVDDAHVRALLDQRAQRADVPATRFSAFSDRSPSLYSHASNNYRSPHFHGSPFPLIDDYHDTNSLPTPAFGGGAHSPPAHTLDDPNSSSLDLTDDASLSECGSGHILPSDDHQQSVSYSDDDESTSLDADGSILESRLSLMGPKMRVHSRAPWELDEDEVDDPRTPFDDGCGADDRSIFGGKNNKTPKFAMMRGLGFGGAKSPVPRKSSDSASTSKGKASFETSSGSSITTGGAIQVLAQASISTSSLSAMPNHLLVPGSIAGRERSLSVSSAGSDAPPLPSPRSAVFSQRSSGANSPHPDEQHYSSSNPPRPSYASERSEPPSPQRRERKGSFVHPYANPVHSKPYDRTSFIDPLGQDPAPANSHMPMSSKASAVTLASEETLTFTHSSASTNSAFTSSSIDLGSSTSATSQFSSVSNFSSANEGEPDSSRNMRYRRETKLGPIGQPAGISQTIFSNSPSYTLISLEQAQEKAKLRNRSATVDETSIPRSPLITSFHQSNDVDAAHPLPPTPQRTRTTSGSSKLKYALSVDVVKGDTGPISPLAGSFKHGAPVVHPGGKVIKQKRSGFMKLFNAKDKQVDDLPPPVPPIHDAHPSGRPSESDYVLSSQPVHHQMGKQMLHRVPVPALPSTGPIPPQRMKEKKVSPPPLSIKVTPHPAQSRRPEKAPISTNSLNVDMIPSFKITPSKPPVSAPPTTTNFTGLSVRPVSSFFESTFATEHLAPEALSASPSKSGDTSTSPTSYSSEGISPVSAGSFSTMSLFETGKDADPEAVIAALKEQVKSNRKIWQQQVWELEGQIRDLKEEVSHLKEGDKCEACGRSTQKPTRQGSSGGGVIHRPRAKTGTGARFASGNDC